MTDFRTQRLRQGDWPLGDWREKATITVEEAGEILGIGRSSAYAGARSGDIPTIRVGRRLLVPVHQLRVMLGELSET